MYCLFEDNLGANLTKYPSHRNINYRALLGLFFTCMCDVNRHHALLIISLFVVGFLTWGKTGGIFTLITFPLWIVKGKKNPLLMSFRDPAGEKNRSNVFLEKYPYINAGTHIWYCRLVCVSLLVVSRDDAVPPATHDAEQWVYVCCSHTAEHEMLISRILLALNASTWR